MSELRGIAVRWQAWARGLRRRHTRGMLPHGAAPTLRRARRARSPWRLTLHLHVRPAARPWPRLATPTLAPAAVRARGAVERYAPTAGALVRRAWRALPSLRAAASAVWPSGLHPSRYTAPLPGPGTRGTQRSLSFGAAPPLSLARERRPGLAPWRQARELTRMLAPALLIHSAQRPAGNGLPARLLLAADAAEPARRVRRQTARQEPPRWAGALPALSLRREPVAAGGFAPVELAPALAVQGYAGAQRPPGFEPAGPDVEVLTDHVMRQLDRRLVAYRERMGTI